MNEQDWIDEYKAWEEQKLEYGTPQTEFPLLSTHCGECIYCVSIFMDEADGYVPQGTGQYWYCEIAREEVKITNINILPSNCPLREL